MNTQNPEHNEHNSPREAMNRFYRDKPAPKQVNRSGSVHGSRQGNTYKGLWQVVVLGPIFALFVLILPVFFTPLTTDPVGINKFFLLTAFSGLGLLALLTRALSQGKIVFTKSLVHVGLLTFILGVVFSVVWGGVSSHYYLQLTPAATGAVTLIASAVLYFIVNSINTSVERSDGGGGMFSLSRLLYAIIIGSALAALIGFLQLGEIYVWPWQFTKTPIFNTVGTVNALGVIAGIGFILSFVKLLSAGKSSGTSISQRILLGLTAIVNFTFLLNTNFKPIWIATAGVGLVLIAFQLATKGIEKISEITAPFTLLVISLFFTIAPIQISFFSTPLEVNPSTRSTLSIHQSVTADRPFFGSGPGTFPYEWQTHRSEALNVTQFWPIRFSEGSTYFLTLLVEVGYVGIALWGALIGLAVWQGMRVVTIIARGKGSAEDFAPFAGFLFTLLVSFFYQLSLVAVVYLVLLLSMSVVVSQRDRVVKIDFSKPPFKTLSFSLSLMTLVVIVLFGLYFASQRFAGEVLFASAFSKNTLEQSISSLERSVRLNQQDDAALRTLSRAYLLRANEIVSVSEKPEFSNDIIQLADAAVKTAKQATIIAPHDSLNWINLGSVYESLATAIDGASSLAIQAYEEARTVDPSNPSVGLGMARANVAEANRVQSVIAQENQRQAEGYSDRVQSLQSQREQLLRTAQSHLESTIDQKANYEPAYFLLAQVQTSLGESSEAIVSVSNWVALNKGDAGRWFQLGLLYYQSGDNGSAELAFQQAVTLLESYSNARYFLGLIQAADGRTTDALNQFNRIAELNPENEEVQQIISNLKADRPVLSGISGPAPEERKQAPIDGEIVPSDIEDFEEEEHVFLDEDATDEVESTEELTAQ